LQINAQKLQMHCSEFHEQMHCSEFHQRLINTHPVCTAYSSTDQRKKYRGKLRVDETLFDVSRITSFHCCISHHITPQLIDVDSHLCHITSHHISSYLTSCHISSHLKTHLLVTSYLIGGPLSHLIFLSERGSSTLLVTSHLDHYCL
jgi:hypothetical protein